MFEFDQTGGLKRQGLLSKVGWVRVEVLETI